MNNKNEFWRGRATFVTGGTGLVGGWLVNRLVDHGADVTALVRDWVPRRPLISDEIKQKVNIVRGDICDQQLVERVLGEYEIKTVIHLAAQTIVGIANRNPISTFQSNIQGTWSVLEACRRSPAIKEIVVASSDKAYGVHEILPYNEKAPLQGVFPYDVSKSCGDLIAKCYAVSYGLPIAITRCGNFFGGGDLNWNRIVPGTIRSVMNGERPIIRSDGRFIRDYFYVEDGAAAYMHLAEQLSARPELRGEAFNFSNEVQLSVLQIVNLILEKMGSNLEPEIRNEASNEIPVQYLDSTKARNILEWTPLFTINDAIVKTISWYKSNRSCF